ncbi:MAG: phosphoenolpyruvate--protein phosphotransferase [Gemmatimonadota bacterium]|nr:phosphoenolpyruvate--protein phosphotransferase [Gemmatimonadota bacterium]
MSRVLEGLGASPGRALGTAWRLDWDIPPVPHRTIGADEVDAESSRFEAARLEALERVESLRRETAERFGRFEGKVFESQACMIEDPELVEGTLAYIRANHVGAERAFELQILEHRVRMLDSGHAMVIDRLADLHDVRVRVLARLQDRPDPALDLAPPETPSILVVRELAPSLAVRLDPETTVGIVMGSGSRGSHSVLLARSLGIPVVVGVGARLGEIPAGERLLIDGRAGHLVIGPAEEEVEAFRRAVAQAERRREMLNRLAGRPTETVDGVHTVVQANLDQPVEAEEAIRLGADGVGLLRSEFLVIGRREVPGEEEQREAYEAVLRAFPGQEVTLRTFDVGGDKFPLFLAMEPEENPFLGWRAIRVCLDRPDLFRAQLRAALRAARAVPDPCLRLLLPLVISAAEIRRTRDLLATIRQEVEPRDEGHRLPLGIMVETPAAVETIDLLAPWVDFVSLGTNDLTQYTLAADRGNARLAGLYDSLHPALIRMYARLARDCARHELDLSVCGELAADPVGVAILLGLGYRKFSVSPASLAEIRELLRHLSVEEMERVCAGHARWESAFDARSAVERHFEATAALSIGNGFPDARNGAS